MLKENQRIPTCDLEFGISQTWNLWKFWAHLHPRSDKFQWRNYEIRCEAATASAEQPKREHNMFPLHWREPVADPSIAFVTNRVCVCDWAACVGELRVVGSSRLPPAAAGICSCRSRAPTQRQTNRARERGLWGRVGANSGSPRAHARTYTELGTEEGAGRGG